MGRRNALGHTSGRHDRGVEASGDGWCGGSLGRRVEEGLRDRLGLGDDVALLGLGGELSLSLVTVPLAPAVLLEGVLHRNLLAEDVLAVEVGDGGVAAVKVAKADKAEALACAAVLAGDLGQTEQGAEAAEGVVEDLLVDGRVEVADEELGADVGTLLLIGRGLVDAQRFPVELDAIHDVGRVLSVGRGAELDETEALMRLGDAVAGHVDVVDGAHLKHDLIYHGRRGALVDVADVDGRVLVLLPVASQRVVGSSEW